jgi:hypothetical protein
MSGYSKFDVTLDETTENRLRSINKKGLMSLTVSPSTSDDTLKWIYNHYGEEDDKVAYDISLNENAGVDILEVIWNDYKDKPGIVLPLSMNENLPRHIVNEIIDKYGYIIPIMRNILTTQDLDDVLVKKLSDLVFTHKPQSFELIPSLLHFVEVSADTISSLIDAVSYSNFHFLGLGTNVLTWYRMLSRLPAFNEKLALKYLKKHKDHISGQAIYTIAGLPGSSASVIMKLFEFARDKYPRDRPLDDYAQDTLLEIFNAPECPSFVRSMIRTLYPSLKF